MNKYKNIQNRFRIESIEDSDINYIMEMCVRLFTEAAQLNYDELFFYCQTDFDISKKAVLDGEIIGCYLLNQSPIKYRQLHHPEQLEQYKTRNSLHGVALGIVKEYRGLSFGRQLRDSVLKLNDYDYMWGYHAKILNNLDNWLKFGRRLIGEADGNYITLMDLKSRGDLAA